MKYQSAALEAARLITLCLPYCALPYSTFVHPLGLGSTVHVATGAITSYANSGALGCAWLYVALCWLTGGVSSLVVAGWKHPVFIALSTTRISCMYMHPSLYVRRACHAWHVQCRRTKVALPGGMWCCWCCTPRWLPSASATGANLDACRLVQPHVCRTEFLYVRPVALRTPERGQGRSPAPRQPPQLKRAGPSWVRRPQQECRPGVCAHARAEVQYSRSTCTLHHPQS